MHRHAAAEWADRYRRAWERRDADAAVSLFTPDAPYRSSPFREPYVGREAIHDYWSTATSTQEKTVVWIGTPLVDRDRVAVEWWATWIERDDGPVTLPGVLFLDFSADGRCRSLRENWALNSDHIEPYRGWGGMVAGNTDATRRHAVRWTELYRAAWLAGDDEEEAATYAETATFRPSPFRPQLHGRDAILQHNLTAYATETEREVWFGSPIVEGGSATVEWWASVVDGGRDMTVSGCSILTFDDAGLAADVRDVWNEADGRRGPHPGWG